RLVCRGASFSLSRRSVAAIHNKLILPAAFDDEQRPPAGGGRTPFPPDAAVQETVILQINRIGHLPRRRKTPACDTQRRRGQRDAVGKIVVCRRRNQQQ